MSQDLVALLYLVSGVLFILALRGLSSPETSRQGNFLGIAGMALAIVTTLASHPPAGIGAWLLVVLGLTLGGGAGAVIARRVPMTAMPQLVAAFHSLVGLAAVVVAAGALYAPDAFGIGTVGAIHGASLVEMSLGLTIGAITFTGSVIAFLKLDGRMSGRPILLPLRHVINLALVAFLIFLIVWFVRSESYLAFWLITLTSFLIGVLIIVPIGGADMPVVISMLNSYSGWAAAGIGFSLNNPMLIIAGSLVGSSGAILSFIMGNAETVIIVPGYGLAVARAQHAVKELATKLTEKGVTVKYAIHTVAGRMPGHMNVLLAEAEVPYDQVFEMEDINGEFGTADVALILGANDVVNPLAEQKGSPIYGMPILEAYKTMMVFGDAKKVVEDLVKAID